jgi:hypothetical protein
MRIDSRTNGVSLAGLRYNFPSAVTTGTVTVGCAVKNTNVESTSVWGNLHFGTNMYIGPSTTGSVGGWKFVYPGGSYTSPSGTYALNSWYYLQMQFTLGTDQNCSFRVDDREWFNGNYTGTISSLSFAGISPSAHASFSAEAFFDDFYVLDSTGTANTGYLGDVIAKIYVPTADTTTESDGSDGNQTDNYLLVDEGRNISTADYITTTGSDIEDTFEFQDVSSQEVIRGLKISTYANKDSGGAIDIYGRYDTGTLAADVDPGGTKGIMQQTSSFHDFIIEKDPDTSALWLPSGVNGTSFGIRTEEV